MISTRIVDAIGRADWDLGIDESSVALDETGPLVILGHTNRATTEILDRAVGVVRLALEDAGVGIVCLLDFSDND